MDLQYIWNRRQWLRAVVRLFSALSVISVAIVLVILGISRLVPEGDQIAFMNGETFDEWDVYLLDLDRQLHVVLTDEVGSDRYPAWSPDGDRLVYHSSVRSAQRERGYRQIRDSSGQVVATQGETSFDLYVHDLNSGRREMLTFSGDNPLEYNQAMAVFSPDGTQLVFHHGTGLTYNSEYDLYITDANGQNPQRILAGVGNAIQAAWSPDGSTVAFAVGRDRDFAIYTLNLDAARQNEVPHRNQYVMEQLVGGDGNQYLFPAWSPDGEQIAYVVDDALGGLQDIWVMNADGSNPRNLTQSTLIDDTHPAWSADGEWLIYASAENRMDNYDLYRIHLETGAIERLTDLPGSSMAPEWRPR